ncbi:MAG: hypothetical protein QOJ65_50 [Fimbriimonadaceae bacterium]|nr:hypothetical protein [Fimbriimonadaceae bacterium]
MWEGLCIEDAYKWLYQATLGPEHALETELMSRRTLETEWLGLDEPQEKEPESYPLRPDGLILRLNLRPYKADGGRMDLLSRSFYESSLTYKTPKKIFVTAWLALKERLAESGVPDFSQPDWRRVNDAMEQLDYPPIRHSNAYRALWDPAYRVLTASSFAFLAPI